MNTWPNTLTADQAAEYVDCVSAAQFRREVAQGVWPPPIAKYSRPQRWSRFHLDARLNPPQHSVTVDQESLAIDTALRTMACGTR